MEKHFSITSILEEIEKTTDFHLVEIVDYWDGDFCAIGLKKDDKLVYISTYNYINEQQEFLDYDFEIIEKEAPLNIVKEVRAGSVIYFLEDLKFFLGI